MKVEANYVVRLLPESPQALQSLACELTAQVVAFMQAPLGMLSAVEAEKSKADSPAASSTTGSVLLYALPSLPSHALVTHPCPWILLAPSSACCVQGVM